MKCLKCNHVFGSALIKCLSCGQVYDRAGVQRLEHLESLLLWLDEHAATISEQVYARLRSEVMGELHSVRAALLPPAEAQAAAPTRPPAEIYKEILGERAILVCIDEWERNSIIGKTSATSLRNRICVRLERLERELGGRAVEVVPPSETQVTDRFAATLATLIEWQDMTDAEAQRLRAYIDAKRRIPSRPEPAVPTSPPSPVAPPPAAIPEPALRAPKPAAPPFDWGKLWSRAWELVVSGAMLRGLLYLGAFMIVISAIVLVLVYWSVFPPLLQLALVAALPLSFYLAGMMLRAWLKLPVAGGVFVGIGALLVAVDFIAVYQLGGLGSVVGPMAYWVAASTITTAIYVLTAWRIPGEFFGHITLIGVSSTVLAVTQFLRLPLEEGFAAVAASCAVMVEAAARVRVAPK